MSKNQDRLPREFEGPEVLGELLAASGCELTVEEVVDEFECAVEEGTPGHEIIGLLWELEPAFESPTAARRTFSNLFGLWDRVAAGAVADLIQLPELAAAGPISPAHAEHAWRAFDRLSDRDQASARDQFDNGQDAVVAFVMEHLGSASEAALSTALELAFETWWIIHRLREATGRTDRTELTALLEAETPPAEPEPALAGLTVVSLWERAADDETPLPEDEIPLIESVIRAVRIALIPTGH